MRQFVGFVVLAVLSGLSFNSATAATCPFCSAVSATFSEEMATMDVVVFAELVKAADPPADLRDASTITQAEFRIVEILKGREFAQVGQTIATIYLGDAEKGDRFLVQGVRPPDIAWSTPMRVSARGMRYLASLSSVPDEGPERLRFFVDFLEDDDEMLARDSYDEFARAPYEDVIAIKEVLDREKLLGWIADAEISASRKRLYYTLLGVSGSEDDLPTLERLMRSNDRQDKAGLDALIACYLTLRGDEGLGLIEELFLGNHDADYSDTYSAITALRFHGTDGNVIDRKRIVKSLELMLDRPALADLVIPDLARWEDWEVMGRLVEMFKTADEKTSWIRVPVINYLRACPLPEAKKHLEELAQIDPDAIRRANTFFPVLDEADLDDESEDKEPETEANQPESDGGDGQASRAQSSGQTRQAQREETRSPAKSLAASLTQELSLGALSAADPRVLLVAMPTVIESPQPLSLSSDSDSESGLEGFAPALIESTPVANQSETKLMSSGAPVAASSEFVSANSDDSDRPFGMATDATPVAGSSGNILGAWSDTARFVAAQQSPDQELTTPQGPRLVASTNGPVSLWLVGLLALATLAAALATQWYVLTGRLATMIN
ncbi:MAG: hypothetical protein R3B96_09750 [Pirellulaceae bacterium]|nr:hypothetical protein [Planctomycetales bacterium]